MQPIEHSWLNPCLISYFQVVGPELTAFDLRLVAAQGGGVLKEVVDDTCCTPEQQRHTFVYAPCGLVRD